MTNEEFSRKKRIYISAMENRTAPVRFPPSATSLLQRLSEEGFLVVWEKEWRDYPVIFDDIEASDALLAIVDPVWSSSTWMAIELGYALGYDHWQGVRINPRPIPTFVYRLGKSWADWFVEKRPGVVTFLDDNVENAVAQIKLALGGSGHEQQL